MTFKLINLSTLSLMGLENMNKTVFNNVEQFYDIFYCRIYFYV